MDFGKKTFSESDRESFSTPMKVGMLATVNPQGLPHISLISSIMASSAEQLVWGQFTEGVSKEYVRLNPKTGFLIMSIEKDLWMGKSSWTHSARSGKDYDNFNNQPMFRYNAYFGIHTVHYMDLIGHSGKEALPMPRVIFAAVLTMLAGLFVRKKGQNQVFNHWTRGFLSKADTLKFLAYVDEDGYPVVFPVIQAQCFGSELVGFSTPVYHEFFDQLKPGMDVALYGMSLNMESVLTRGKFKGISGIGGVKTGIVAADWVYNSMPPAAGQIYPPVPLEAVRDF